MTAAGTTREVERKFLVRTDLLPPSARMDGTRIVQGYLAFSPSVRVRVAEQEGEPPRAWLTIKGPGMVERDEFEYEIPVADAQAMLALCHASLTKVRRRVQVGRHTWDIDEFTGPHAGLWLAEIELADAAEPFERPLWLGEEVSEDARYTNSALARAGRAP